MENFKSPKLKALKEQIESGNLKKDIAKIYHIILNHKVVTIPNIIFFSNIKESTVVARLSDLEDMGVITKSGTNKSGKHSYFVPVPNNQISEYQDKVRIRKYLQWVDRGLKNYRDLMTAEMIRELTNKLPDKS